MTFTDKLNTIGRKYIAPTILAGAVALGGYGCEKKAELPINQKTGETIVAEQNREYEAKQKQVQIRLDEMTNNYWTKLNSAKSKFNEYVGQRDTLTVEEQESLFAIYRSALDLRNEITNYAKSKGMRSSSKLIFPKEHSNLYNLLNCNLNGAECGMTGLEKALKNSGINIPVEKKITSVDYFVAYGLVVSSMLGLAVGMAGGLAGVFKLKNEIKRKRKNKNDVLPNLKVGVSI